MWQYLSRSLEGSKYPYLTERNRVRLEIRLSLTVVLSSGEVGCLGAVSDLCRLKLFHESTDSSYKWPSPTHKHCPSFLRYEACSHVLWVRRDMLDSHARPSSWLHGIAPKNQICQLWEIHCILVSVHHTRPSHTFPMQQAT